MCTNRIIGGYVHVCVVERCWVLVSTGSVSAWLTELLVKCRRCTFYDLRCIAYYQGLTCIDSQVYMYNVRVYMPLILCKTRPYIKMSKYFLMCCTCVWLTNLYVYPTVHVHLLQVFVIGQSNGELYHIWQSERDASWSDWEKIGGLPNSPFQSQPAMMFDDNGWWEAYGVSEREGGGRGEGREG